MDAGRGNTTSGFPRLKVPHVCALHMGLFIQVIFILNLCTRQMPKYSKRFASIAGGGKVNIGGVPRRFSYSAEEGDALHREQTIEETVALPSGVISFIYPFM